MERTEIYNQFEELNKRASQGGGIDKIEKQHAAGRMTARERIEALLDKGCLLYNLTLPTICSV